MKIIDRKHLCTFITLQNQKIMKFLRLVLNVWPRLYIWKFSNEKTTLKH